MHIDKLYKLYLEQAKNQVVTFLDEDRTKVCQWIRKIEQVPQPDADVKKLQLHSLKLFLLCLDSKFLNEPFDKSPEDNKTFAEYNWQSYDLDEFADSIRSKKVASKGPATSFTTSGDRRRLLSYQNDPANGAESYFATSEDPLESWDNLSGGAIPHETIEDWKRRGELDTIPRTVSENASPIRDTRHIRISDVRASQLERPERPQEVNEDVQNAYGYVPLMPYEQFAEIIPENISERLEEDTCEDTCEPPDFEAGGDDNGFDFVDNVESSSFDSSPNRLLLIAQMLVLGIGVTMMLTKFAMGGPPGIS